LDLVSIIVPIYNCEKWLPRCIESILNQSYKNIELILVNDGSTDNSKDVCESYAEKDDRVRVFTIENNGVSNARNFGMSQANGEYIIFSDSDDWLIQDSVKRLYDTITKTESDFCSGLVNNVTALSNNVPFFATKAMTASIKDAESWYQFIRLLDWAPWGKLYKKSIIMENSLEFPLGIKSGEDSIFLSRYLNCCNKVASTDELVYYYNRLLPNSAINKYYADYNVWMAEYLKEIAKMFNLLSESEYKSNEFFGFFAVNKFFDVCMNYTKCDKEEALVKLEESYNLFKPYFGADTALLEEAVKSRKTKSFFDDFMRDENYEDLLQKLYSSKSSETTNPVKSVLKSIKIKYLLLNKKYLTK